MDLVKRMKELAELLREEGNVKAHHDPAKAMANRPCLLVAPAPVEWGDGTLDGTPLVEWQIVALAGRQTGGLDAVRELWDLVQAARAVLSIERATPAPYRIGDQQPVPAYICTHTEYADLSAEES